ncbi:uncharacterized protein CC84DRAFT_1103478 [Paraphaeosphaeria sporulosa]|uniref:Transferase family protein n=1 Tax=Paraphaeosphaeria sporulosa TaxID=1460663 RepID=A0A177BWN6_9PLEO|nr:uncharacterized protein CC84DRAFT_1103478 [Paraphaeosphaeria sporulosa]OAF99545.1 hypothetical protein CC84DRAFT_1103478 [Paraphaeosphaeria sporulosa]
MAPPRVEILSETRLHPATWHGEETTTPLSIIDASVARFTPAGAVWYFPSPAPFSIPDPLSPDLLKKSLAHTLSAYPHWAGQLRMTPYTPESPGRKRRNEERYGRMEGRSDDPGVLFVSARAGCEMRAALPPPQDGIKDCDGMVREDVLLPACALAGYLSPAEHWDVSVAVQVTRFACGGTAVGVKISHCLADAITLARFVKDWSATHAALLTDSPLPELGPVFEPCVLDSRAGRSLDNEEPDEAVLEKAYRLPLHRYDYWCSGQGSKFGPGAHQVPEILMDEPRAKTLARKGETMPWSSWDVSAPVGHVVVHYTSEQLERIWSAAAGGNSGKGSGRLSRHDALVAHVWALVNRVRGAENGDVDSEVHCDISIGLRTRVEPPLSPSFLGSPLLNVKTTLPWSVASSVAALPRIASSIKATLSCFTPAAVAAQIYATAYELAPQRLWQAFLGRQHVIVTSWAHTGLYGCDFGTGLTPAYVHPIMPLVDGCVQVMEARPTAVEAPPNRWYDAGVDVAIYLEKEAMGRLVRDEHVLL